MILGIETSCDETSVALLEEDGRVRANLIASQIETHRPYGGVVPEIASREHLQHLMPLIRRALEENEASLEDISAIAVTSGPGLIGALLVGVAAAQGLSYGSARSLIAVNHLDGHLLSAFLRGEEPALELPRHFYSLVVSGGHSSIYEVSAGHVTVRNRTRDDAAGEIFDKVAKYVGLPYPGGPHVDRLAKEGDPRRFPFTLPQFKDGSSDFSFSGLKANAIRLADAEGVSAPADGEPSSQLLSDFCASLQSAIVDQLIDRLDRVTTDAQPGTPVCLTGGVAANSALRARFEAWAEARELVPMIAERRFCTDNAAMIAHAGLHRLREAGPEDTLRVPARSRWQPGE